MKTRKYTKTEMIFLKWFYNNNYNTYVEIADSSIYIIEFHESYKYEIRFLCFQNNKRLLQHDAIIILSYKDFEELFEKSK